MTAVATAPTISSSAELGGKYLTFNLDQEEYGVEILKVREIIGMMDITSVPQMPAFIKGVINLRGKVIPVVDLRLKFGLDQAEYNDQTCTIVVDVGAQIGVIVDTVQEVLDIADEQIEPPPPMSGAVDTRFILGMGKVKDDVKILLDIDKVLAVEELGQIGDSPA
ncbi:MAG: purine-binding chemotaxis protein CheW [Phycisphaerales bacterium]|nr:purine-binding chemotaxis protein CheW [Phycisphaerales bacterium]